jgi:hypothetical protein
MGKSRFVSKFRSRDKIGAVIGQSSDVLGFKPEVSAAKQGRKNAKEGLGLSGVGSDPIRPRLGCGVDRPDKEVRDRREASAGKNGLGVARFESDDAGRQLEEYYDELKAINMDKIRILGVKLATATDASGPGDIKPEQ